jgi:hypothetical protein
MSYIPPVKRITIILIFLQLVSCHGCLPWNTPGVYEGINGVVYGPANPPDCTLVKITEPAVAEGSISANIPDKGDVKIDWEPLPGAESYMVYVYSEPRTSPGPGFGPQPITFVSVIAPITYATMDLTKSKVGGETLLSVDVVALVQGHGLCTSTLLMKRPAPIIQKKSPTGTPGPNNALPPPPPPDNPPPANNPTLPPPPPPQPTAVPTCGPNEYDVDPGPGLNCYPIIR